MTIAENLTRIKNAVDDIKAAITEQGLTISEDAKIEDLAQKIRDIRIGSTEDLEFFDYLQGNGQSYILTDYIPTTNTILEVKFEHKTLTAFTPVFGSRNGAGKGSLLAAITSNSQLLRVDMDNKTNTLTDDSITNSIITLKLDVLNNKAYINGEEKELTSTTSTQTDFKELCIFGLNTNGSILSAKYDGKLYYIKIWEGNTLVRHYKAAIKENSKRGLYEVVYDLFYLSATDNSFVSVGNDISN